MQEQPQATNNCRSGRPSFDFFFFLSPVHALSTRGILHRTATRICTFLSFGGLVDPSFAPYRAENTHATRRREAKTCDVMSRTRKRHEKKQAAPSRTGLRRLHRPRRAALAGAGAGGEAHLDVPARVVVVVLLLPTTATLLAVARLRGRRRAATPDQPPQPGARLLRRRVLLRLRAAGADLVLGAEEEDVGGEVGGLRVGLGRGHGGRDGRVVHGGAPAERAGGVGAEPHVDAVHVEGVPAPRQHARRLPRRQLRDAHGAVRRLVAPAHLPPGQLRHRLVVEPAVVAPLRAAADVRACASPDAEHDAQPRPDAAAAGGGHRVRRRLAAVPLGAEEDVEAEHQGQEDRRHGRQHRGRRRDRRRGHRHRTMMSSDQPLSPSLPFPSPSFPWKNDLVAYASRSLLLSPPPPLPCSAPRKLLDVRAAKLLKAINVVVLVSCWGVGNSNDLARLLIRGRRGGCKG
uniref:Uncharacterized protein n=1 Tax=Zea mays TaxID=4577 RepID=A0A804QE31_MAIZE